MRTTITLTPDAEAIVRQAMAERGLTFKEAVNEAIVRSAATRPRLDLTWPTYELELRFDPDRANALLADLDDAEIIAKVGRGA